MANLFWGKKKIAVVGVNGNPMAKRIVEEMKAQGMKGVVELDAPKAYPDYYTLAQLEPDYVLFVYESAQCKVKITRVEGLLGDRLGHNVRRDTEESKQAQGYYKHQLKMVGIDPILLGAEEIPLREVKDIPWFYTSKVPVLHLHLPKAEGAEKAVCKAVQDYFRE